MAHRSRHRVDCDSEVCGRLPGQVNRCGLGLGCRCWDPNGFTQSSHALPIPKVRHMTFYRSWHSACCKRQGYGRRCPAAATPHRQLVCAAPPSCACALTALLSLWTGAIRAPSLPIVEQARTEHSNSAGRKVAFKAALGVGAPAPAPASLQPRAPGPAVALQTVASSMLIHALQTPKPMPRPALAAATPRSPAATQPLPSKAICVLASECLQ